VTVSDDNVGISTVSVFLVGLSIGAAVALLLAPKTGKDIRKMIGRKAEDTSDYVQSKGKEVLAQLQELVEQAQTLVEEGRKTVEKVAEAGRGVASKVGA
jgi:gas vesicle protein